MAAAQFSPTRSFPSRALDMLWRALAARAAVRAPGLAAERATEVSRWREAHRRL